MLDSGVILQNRYRILRKLGQGGMGTVYLAEDERFGSKVALKETHFNQARLRHLRPREQARLRKAFRQEARLLNGLRHSALPHVIDYFIEDEGHYLVMQFIEGKDLEEMLVERKRDRLGPFPPEQVLEWADQLLDALEYLHGQRTPVIHRDIKPQNLKVDAASGEVILLDFGLAKGAAGETSQASGSLHGYTRHYAPLEQIERTGADPRSDLYALAATMHRLLTGEMPPPAPYRASAILSGRPDPLRPANQINPQTPAAVAAALTRALSQNPGERPATAREMREDLRLAARSNDQRHEASFVVDDAQSQIEIPVATDPELEVVITQPESVTRLESTFAGQTASVSDSQLGSTLRLEPSPEPIRAERFRLTPRMVWMVGGVLSLVIFAAVVLAFRGRQRTISPPSPPARVEVMKYCLAIEAAGGKEKNLAGDPQIAANQKFKLRFASREHGYLYIIGRNAKESLTTFLTARPNPDWGVESNRIAAGGDYSFPPRQDKWLRVTGYAEVESFLIVFAATPLSAPAFLNESVGRELTDPEQRDLAEFRQRLQAEVKVEQSGDQFIVTAPGERPSGAPLVFEINVKRRIKRADEEGVKR